jgi:ankyrin repeat protein
MLFFPISEGNLELVDNASVFKKLSGFTPAELALRYEREDIYRFLIARGTIPVDRGTKAQLLLVQTTGTGNIDGMAKAIDEGAQINAVGSTNQTALVAALRIGVNRPSESEAGWWLLKKGTDPNKVSESYFKDLQGVPLYLLLAMTIKRPESQTLMASTLALMLDKGAKVSGMDSKGRTPLHIAAKYDQLRAAEILISRGTKIQPTDEFGKMPLDYAESGPMIQLLKSHGAIER